MTRILIINGHPDAGSERLCAALMRAYQEGARQGGHEVRTLALGRLSVPLIASRAEFEDGAPPEPLRAAQESIRWCNHLVLIHPLWQGAAPALVKAFFEQTFRYGFAVPRPGGAGGPGGLLKGRSARVVVTMGMPAGVYRLIFGAFGVRAFTRGVLRLAGFGPVRRTLLGGVETATPGQRDRWLARMTDLGRLAA